MQRYEVTVEITSRDSFTVEARNRQDAEYKACCMAGGMTSGSGVTDTWAVEVECLDGGEQQFDITITLSTLARNVEEAMAIAIEKVVERKDYYVELDKNGHRETEGHISEFKCGVSDEQA